MEHKAKTGELFIVATPIGNLQDISLRAIEVLKAVDTIYCEDTRHSRKLMERHAIGTPLQPYHEHNAQTKRPAVLQKLENGDAIALISDAGTPLISDPGYKLVAETRAQGFKVTPIAGACAAIAALSAAGLPSDRFLFVGFLPNKQLARRSALSELTTMTATLIFYESPKRLAAMLADAASCFGADRPAVVARELTKQFEEFASAPLQQLADDFAARDSIKGEIVVLIQGADNAALAVDDATFDSMLTSALKHHPVKQAANEVAEQTGRSKRECYQRALELKDS